MKNLNIIKFFFLLCFCLSSILISRLNLISIEQNNDCIVIISGSTSGRLGNRMFRFASAFGLARSHGCRLYIEQSLRIDLSNNFQMLIDENLFISNEEFSRLKNIRNVSTVCSFLPDLFKPRAFKYLQLLGYWQSYLYFDNYRNEIRRLFTGRNTTLIKLADYFSNLLKTICYDCRSIPTNLTHSQFRQILQNDFSILWIGIHIRARDFRLLQYISDESYIFNAMSYYKQRFSKQKIYFLIATDEKPFYQRIFSNNKTNETFILPNEFTPVDDLIALSLCHHTIITGGTFSFWTGYLSGGEVIHDVKYRIDCPKSDYYPPWFSSVLFS